MDFILNTFISYGKSLIRIDDKTKLHKIYNIFSTIAEYTPNMGYSLLLTYWSFDGCEKKLVKLITL